MVLVILGLTAVGGPGAAEGAAGGRGANPSPEGPAVSSGDGDTADDDTASTPVGAVGAVPGSRPASVRGAEGMVEGPDGGWWLAGRTGRLRVSVPAGSGLLTFQIPKGGPAVFAPAGEEVRVVAATPQGLVYQVVPAAGRDWVELVFTAVEGTTRPEVGPVGWQPPGASAQFSSRSAGGDRLTVFQAEPARDPALAWVRFAGGGNGHRAGLSQYGAQGLGRLGVSYQAILAHYFPGTRLGQWKARDTAQPVRVGLSLDVYGRASTDGRPVPRPEWTVQVPAGTVARGANGTAFCLPAGRYRIRYVAAANGGNGGTPAAPAAPAGDCQPVPAAPAGPEATGFRFEPTGPTRGEPFVVPIPGTMDLAVPAGQAAMLFYPLPQCNPELVHAYQGCRRYEGRLQFQVQPQSGAIYVRNLINARQYLTGVVPHEMPASWSEGAVKAQAVAARTFAARQNFGLDQDLVDSTADQVFYGVYRDGTPDGRYEKRIAQVLAETDGQVVLTADGQLAPVYYSSANGGWIASNTEAFGDGRGTPLAHLQGRRDLFRLGNISLTPEAYWYGGDRYEGKNFRWEQKVAASAVESTWPQIGRLQSIRVTERSQASRTVLEVEIRGSAGQVKVTGSQLRRAFGLLSTFLLPDQIYPRQFYDVPMDTTLGPEINGAYQLGLVSGDVDARYGPDQPLTRAAFAKMLVRVREVADGKALPGPDNDASTQDEPFTDVEPGLALYAEVVKAYKAGIVLGYEGGTYFGYDRPVTREEAAAIVQRALGLEEQPEPFPDVSDQARLAGAIGAVYQAGIMRGDKDQSRFRPTDSMTRGEAAAVALRSYNYYCSLHACAP